MKGHNLIYNRQTDKIIIFYFINTLLHLISFNVDLYLPTSYFPANTMNCPTTEDLILK